MSDKLKAVSFSMGLTVSADLEPTTYGPVRLKRDRVIYRSYKRVIPNGTSLLDLCRIQAERTRRKMEKMAAEVFNAPPSR